MSEFDDQLAKTAISFGSFLISDYIIVSVGEELLWQLAGTNQNYTSEQLFYHWMKEKETEKETKNK